MSRNKLWLAFMVFVLSNTSTAEDKDNCTEIIRLSRTISNELSDEGEFQDKVRHFCDEFQLSRTEGRAANYGGSYKVLKLSMGKSSQNAENVASKYCRFERDARQSQSTYREYLEGIAPGAYAAYQSCVAARAEGVVVELAREPRQNILELVVFHRNTDPNATADLSVSSSNPVDCQWESRDAAAAEDSRVVSLRAQTRTRLRCTREDWAVAPIHEPDFVHLIRETGGTANVNFDWSKYNEKNEPVESIAAIRARLEERAEEMAVELQAANSALQKANDELDHLNAYVAEYMNRTWKDVTAERYPYPNSTPTNPITGSNNGNYPIDISLIYEGRRFDRYVDFRDYAGFCYIKIIVDGKVVEHSIRSWHAGDQQLLCSSNVTIPPRHAYEVHVQPKREDYPGWWKRHSNPLSENSRIRILRWMELSAN